MKNKLIIAGIILMVLTIFGVFYFANKTAAKTNKNNVVFIDVEQLEEK